MQILFSRTLNKKELAFQEGSIDAGVSKALAHVCSLMMKVRKEPVTEGACTLFGKVVTMTFSNSLRLTKCCRCWEEITVDERAQFGFLDLMLTLMTGSHRLGRNMYISGLQKVTL